MAESGNMTISSSSKPWSETRNGRIAIAAGMVGLFVLVFWQAMKSRQILSEPTALVVDDQYISFGGVWEDPVFIWTLPIRNTTNEEIEIAGFAASCSCVKIQPSSITLPAYGTAQVRLTLNLQSAHNEPDLYGKDFQVAIQPRISKGAGSQVGWVVKGKIKQPFAFDPPVIDFKESLVRGLRLTPGSAIITCGLDIG
jgi:hypothetical protein